MEVTNQEQLGVAPRMLHVVQEDRSPYWLKDTQVRVRLYVKPLIFWNQSFEKNISVAEGR